MRLQSAELAFFVSKLADALTPSLQVSKQLLLGGRLFTVLSLHSSLLGRRCLNRFQNVNHKEVYT